jgi:meso-butanediol dehydrogenase / (S,S)-butanediol dehydrogenase / diacetyl reductase
MKRFDGKVALITGAAAGIGAATARRLASEGAAVFLADINLAGAEAVAAQLGEEFGVKTFAAAFDAGDSQSCAALVAQAVAAMQRLDVVCNVAGIQKWDHFAEISDATWDRMMRINLNSVFVISREAIPHLEKTKGNIVNVSSAAGIIGIAYNAAYCAAKAAVIGLTKSIAVEYAARGVRVNAVAPGGVKSGQAMNPMPEGVDMNLVLRLFPKTGDMCEPEEIAAAIAYLASEEARYVTGTIFNIDGGQLAG